MAGIKYENLPPEIDARFIELILCFDGKALFYYDEELEQYVVLQFTVHQHLIFTENRLSE